MVQIITRNEIKAVLDSQKPLILVEALPARYFNDGHLPGVLQMNPDEVDAKAEKLLPDKTAKIVVYCSNAACSNSAKAANRLSQLGYSNVYKYSEGKQDWIDAGLPVEKSA